MGAASLIRTVDELSAEWLGGAIGRTGVELLGTERIGTGQMSESRRVRIAYADASDEIGGRARPTSVVIKTASEDESSRSTGVGLGVYEREVRFYGELAPRIGGPLARCHAAVIDPAEGWFTIVLEDVIEGVQGDQIAGCTVTEASVGSLPPSLERICS